MPAFHLLKGFTGSSNAALNLFFTKIYPLDYAMSRSKCATTPTVIDTVVLKLSRSGVSEI